MKRVRTPLDLPLMLMLASAVLGVWTSYDQAASWTKFGLLVAAVAIYYAIVWSALLPSGSALLSAITWAFLLGGVAFSGFYASQHDFTDVPGKVGAIAQFGQWLNRTVPQLGYHSINPNIAAGILEIALPVDLALAWSLLSEEGSKTSQIAAVYPLSATNGGSRRFLRLIGLVVVLVAGSVIAFGLLMTTSRGAGLALAGLGIGSLALWWFGSPQARRLGGRIWAPIGVIALSVGVIALAGLGWLNSLLEPIQAGNSAISRAELWGQSVGLIRDYIFTGAGLGVFPMVLSTYALLSNNVSLTHAHNLFLQVWLEQGLLGFVAFVWIVIQFYRWAIREGTDAEIRLGWLAVGGIAATSVMLLHGLVDVLLYSSRGLPLLFVPMALAIAGQKAAKAGRRKTKDEGPLQASERRVRGGKAGAGLRQWRYLLGVLVVAAAVVLVAASRSLVGMWHANLGSVAQSKAELSADSFPAPLGEYARRDCSLQSSSQGASRTSNCAEAKAEFAAALAIDPENLTANQRMAEIELAGGQAGETANYEAALQYAQAAYRQNPGNAVTWELLGDAYLALGRTGEALQFWSRVPGADSKLRTEAEVRYLHQGDKERAAQALALADEIQKGGEVK